MDKKTMIENLVRGVHEKAGFTGTWLYAENGEIVSKGAVGFRDGKNMAREAHERGVFKGLWRYKEFASHKGFWIQKDTRHADIETIDNRIPYFPALFFRMRCTGK